ncbi:histidine phosphatase family protein [Falsibacillus albus]|uniref:Histidine phosphatase family protein n=1 Tax=Falsibacillus albus TaxID=2478915 RepID=A0A3L7JVP5_9BACI|nr:histidine phosphatase family protein [Falsibacillus albus]RLQ94610.1 histidine phosphatase family protein [Falsibacillus albus]
MNTEVYFVRHAHSVFSKENEETRELSEKGWKDAQKITDIMIKENIDHVISSTYVRARQTVEGLAEHFNQEIKLDSRFRERDLAARDHHFEKPLDAIKFVFENPNYKYPGGESNQEVQNRGISGLREVEENYRGKKIAIGIHGNIMTCILSYFDERFDYDFWSQTTKPDIYKLMIDSDFNLVRFERLWDFESVMVK